MNRTCQTLYTSTSKFCVNKLINSHSFRISPHVSLPIRSFSGLKNTIHSYPLITTSSSNMKSTLFVNPYRYFSSPSSPPENNNNENKNHKNSNKNPSQDNYKTDNDKDNEKKNDNNEEVSKKSTWNTTTTKQNVRIQIYGECFHKKTQA